MTIEPSPLEAVIDAITLAYHRLVLASDRLHLDRGLTTGMRSVLFLLEREGPQTVARLAEARSVSRQFLHRLVGTLQAGGWVELADNPRHRRSPLVTLTPKGVAEVAQIRALEAPFLAQLAANSDAAALTAAAQTLQALCAALPGEA
jgi:DNA-binding MarR family transcriptional regulator